ncbi:MAG: serine hydrolase, partial [Anaerolineales bacterium]
MNTKRILLIVVMLLLSILYTLKVAASPALLKNRSALTSREKLTGRTCRSLESVVDNLVEMEMDNAQIPGLVIAIVEDGQLRLEKGYGWSDVNAQIPVSPKDSIFQMGSISKLFTWTAVMQLVEQGKLDLDGDVNQYLEEKLRVESAFDQPIMLADLMSHSAGFEDRVTGIYTQDASKLDNLFTFLASNQPERVHPPGDLISYSNFGTALAAHIV